MIIPTHVAIILDGNRRWAKERGLPTFEGHRQGFERFKNIVKIAREKGVKILTLWAFSTENWKRSKEEVSYLMKLYEKIIDSYLSEAKKNQTRLIHIGRKDRINDILRQKLIKAEEETKNYQKNYLALALDYGGRDEIIRAIKKARNLNSNNFEQFLDTKDLPQQDVDLVIRTSGEKRTSGFLIWQAAYAEYIFYPKYLPDFTPADFDKCLEEYSQRQRRYGK